MKRWLKSNSAMAKIKNFDTDTASYTSLLRERSEQGKVPCPILHNTSSGMLNLS